MSKELLELEALLDLTKKKVEALKDRESYINQRYQEEVISLTKKEKQERIKFLKDLKRELLDPNQQDPEYYYNELKKDTSDPVNVQILDFVDKIRQYKNEPIADGSTEDDTPYILPLLDLLIDSVQYTILHKIWEIIEQEIKKLEES